MRWIAAAVLLVALAAVPAAAKPAYCNCFDCFDASPSARCTIQSNGQVVYCSDYVYWYCIDFAPASAGDEQSVDQFLGGLAAEPQPDETVPAETAPADIEPSPLFTASC